MSQDLSKAVVPETMDGWSIMHHIFSVNWTAWNAAEEGQRAEIVLIMRSKGAVEAVIKHQGKLGADAGLAIAHVGAGVEASVTTNLGADIIAFTDAKGLYGGVSLEGSGMIRRKDFNTDYYGGKATPNAILLDRSHTNPKADGLRNSLVVK